MNRTRLLAARVVAALAGTALLAPTAAAAATVEATDDQCAVGAPQCVTDLRIEAGGSERNVLDVEPDGRGIVVRDAATPLVPGRNCARRDDGSVRCELSRPISQVQIQTGDGDSVVRAVVPDARLVTVIFGRGDDRFEGSAGEVWANGLDGDDTLVALGGTADFEGRKGADVLVGSAASGDELRGGPGRDRVSGGAGDDVLVGGDGDFDGIDDDEVPAADELDGGPGRDTLDYARRELAVRVHLGDGAPDGAPGEGDVLRAIEDVRGGRGGDRLTGDDGPNRLLGGQGDDTLHGLGGDDFLALEEGAVVSRGERAYGGPGDDDVRAGSGGLVVGGDGDDVLRGARDTIALCGDGRDLLRPRPGQSMRMVSDCERWAIRFGGAADLVVATPPRRTGGEVGVTVGCPAGPVCTFTLTVSTRSGRRIARDGVRVRPGRHATVDVRVPARFARRELRVFVRVSDGGGYALGGGVSAVPR